MSNSPTDQLEDELDRLDELMSYFFDDALDAMGAKELDEKLSASPSARLRYVEMAQLHAALVDHYQPERVKTPAVAIAPSLGLPANSQLPATR